MPQILWKWVGILTGSMAALYGSVCLYLGTQQRHLIFVPESKVDHTPADFQVPTYEQIWIPIAHSEERMAAWWIPAETRNAPVVLYLHGNYGNIGANAEHASRFHRLGYAVLLFDYRGFGQSQGSFPSETLVYADAEAAWDELVEKRHISPSRILIYGHSLGGAIAIELAMHHPEAARLIVEASFTSILDLAERDPILRLFPLSQLLTQRFDSLGKVPRIQIPILFIHGTADATIPYTMGQRLFAAAGEPKTLVLIPGGGHSNNATVAPKLYLQTVKHFVNATPKLSTP